MFVSFSSVAGLKSSFHFVLFFAFHKSSANIGLFFKIQKAFGEFLFFCEFVFDWIDIQDSFNNFSMVIGAKIGLNPYTFNL